jgi:hypothetical protein
MKVIYIVNLKKAILILALMGQRPWIDNNEIHAALKGRNSIPYKIEASGIPLLRPFRAVLGCVPIPPGALPLAVELRPFGALIMCIGIWQTTNHMLFYVHAIQNIGS